ncbi:uncharacterized protein BDV17DRAFT_290821 [Aspergillus undulatus]|uniref:uncharacterized protein n=1 Tax=Aspergillus undulatus TaxID=1810928 RepID=UPI003CCCA652
MDHNTAAAWIQEHRIVLWCVPWVLSALWATLGLVLMGYGDIGAWCWFTSDKIRLLVNFTPRWLIILIILALYTRLCVFLYRSHQSISSDYEMLDRQGGSKWCHGVVIPGNGPFEKCIILSTSTAREKMANASQIFCHMMIYPTAYTLIWVVPTAARIYHGTTGRKVPFGLSIVDNPCIISHGFADAIIYGINDRVWSSGGGRGGCR